MRRSRNEGGRLLTREHARDRQPVAESGAHRTDLRTTQVRDVFEGDLDAFILACLRLGEQEE